MSGARPDAHRVESTHVNVVVLHGVLSSAPRVRDLPSGAELTHLEVTTRVSDAAASVPVVVAGADPHLATLDAGDAVVVVGRVTRRYFRAGGVTQSRTEVLAERVVRAGRRQAVDRALRRAAELLDAGGVRVG